jgi:tRNA pseudouridine(38-40) synthase
MPHWKTILTYDGTPFNGWQIQPGLPTIQGTLAQAIQRVTGESVLPQGSGRTDTGVHALGQVATFTLTVPIPAPNLHRALNRALPPSIRILSVSSVPEEFHARHNARRKTYEYRIFPGDRICSPMLAPFVWACRLPLDLASLQQTAAHVLGPHDFTSFAANDPDLTTRTAAATSVAANSSGSLNQANNPKEGKTKIVPSSKRGTFVAAIEIPPHPSSALTGSQIANSQIDSDSQIESENDSKTNPNQTQDDKTIPTDNTRTIYDSTWRQQDDLLIYRVTGSGFLHHMVRNLVGTFVDPTSKPDEIPSILAARNRSSAGPTAPARGLFLVEVEY